jgi:hypothetical protein
LAAPRLAFLEAGFGAAFYESSSTFFKFSWVSFTTDGAVSYFTNSSLVGESSFFIFLILSLCLAATSLNFLVFYSFSIYSITLPSLSAFFLSSKAFKNLLCFKRTELGSRKVKKRYLPLFFLTLGRGFLVGFQPIPSSAVTLDKKGFSPP